MVETHHNHDGRASRHNSAHVIRPVGQQYNAPGAYSFQPSGGLLPLMIWRVFRATGPADGWSIPFLRRHLHRIAHLLLPVLVKMTTKWPCRRT